MLSSHLAKLVLQGRSIVSKQKLDSTFYVMDLNRLKELWHQWKVNIPDITPYYAVKCNPNVRMLEALAHLGCHFDCASAAEIRKVLSIPGMPAERVLFANPTKFPSDIRFAKTMDVRKMTFDTDAELHKISECFPSAECILRIKVDNPAAKCRLGDKYGATLSEVPCLLRLARSLNLTITGLAFHIGSGGKDLNAVRQGLLMCREALQMALKEGHTNVHTIDIGGGFTPDYGDDGSIDMKQVRACTQDAIHDVFPGLKYDGKPLQFIAEPGRFFAESIVTCYSPIYGVRKRQGIHEYWIMESLYGAFNCMIYDHQTPEVHVMRSPRLEEIHSR
jgi:ornithine decarboxylase